MKKILGIFVFTLICILGLCSCASPNQQAVNQDLVDKLNKGQVVVNNAFIELTDTRTGDYYIVVKEDDKYYLAITTSRQVINCSELTQYPNYIKLEVNTLHTTKGVSYTKIGELTMYITFSNNIISYRILVPSTK